MYVCILFVKPRIISTFKLQGLSIQHFSISVGNHHRLKTFKLTNTNLLQNFSNCVVNFHLTSCFMMSDEVFFGCITRLVLSICCMLLGFCNHPHFHPFKTNIYFSGIELFNCVANYHITICFVMNDEIFLVYYTIIRF